MLAARANKVNKAPRSRRGRKWVDIGKASRIRKVRTGGV
jgi:hypothetical protein